MALYNQLLLHFVQRENNDIGWMNICRNPLENEQAWMLSIWGTCLLISTVLFLAKYTLTAQCSPSASVFSNYHHQGWVHPEWGRSSTQSYVLSSWALGSSPEVLRRLKGKVTPGQTLQVRDNVQGHVATEPMAQCCRFPPIYVFYHYSVQPHKKIAFNKLA